MKIYVTGKIDRNNIEETKRKFSEALEKLSSEGHLVFTPTMLPEYEEIPQRDYMHIHCAIIDACDAVYALKDWQKDPLAREELQYAADWRKEILYENPETKEENYPIDRWRSI